MAVGQRQARFLRISPHGVQSLVSFGSTLINTEVVKNEILLVDVGATSV